MLVDYFETACFAFVNKSSGYRVCFRDFFFKRQYKRSSGWLCFCWKFIRIIF